MKKKYYFVLGISLICSQLFYGQSIQGTVHNRENNQVIEGARVTFFNEKGDRLIDMMVDEKGMFEINGKNIESVYKVLGSAEGFNAAEVVVTNISDGFEVNFNLTRQISTARKSTGSAITHAKAGMLLPFYVQYDFNSSYFNDDNQGVADQLLRYMKDNPSQSILVKSYVEMRSNAQYNEWLGDRRAQRIIDYLISAGISASRLQKEVVKSYENLTTREGSAGTAREFRRCDFFVL